MKNHKYLIFAYWFDSRWENFVGASVKIKDLAHNLATMGNKVVLFLPKNNFKNVDFAHQIVEIPFINLPLIRFISFNIFLMFHLLAYLFIKRPVVVYVRRMNSVIPAFYAKLKKAMFIYEINDDPYDKEYQEGSNTVFLLRSAISKKQDEFNLKLCDRAFIITPKLREKIIRYNPFIANHKLKIMPSGANTDLFRPLDKYQCRSQLNFSNKLKIVGFAGSLLKHQGIDTLIKAASFIISKVPLTLFLIIGEGPKKNDWIDMVEKKGLNKNFMFTGQISYENLPIWLGATDICLAPFLSTAGLRSPVKIFDYMACGKAVIASELYGTTDVFHNSGAISLVEPENSKILAEIIIDLLNDTDKAKKMGKNARKFIVANYDRKQFAKKICEESQSVYYNCIEN